MACGCELCRRVFAEVKDVEVTTTKTIKELVDTVADRQKNAVEVTGDAPVVLTADAPVVAHAEAL